MKLMETEAPSDGSCFNVNYSDKASIIPLVFHPHFKASQTVIHCVRISMTGKSGQHVVSQIPGIR